MTDILLPPWITQARVGFRYVDSTGVSRAEFTGKSVTGSKGGDRLAATIEFGAKGNRSSESAVERASLISFLTRLRGRQNRAYLYNPAQRLRGSFPATELLTNNTFANGTTGWTPSSPYDIVVADRVLRIRRNSYNLTSDVLRPTASSGAITTTAYMPYALRVAENVGRGAWTAVGIQLGGSSFGEEYGRITSPVGGLKTLAAVAIDPQMFPGLVDYAGGIAGEYYEVQYISFAQCALVDNPGNSLARSDEFDNATWTKSNCTVTANTTTAPDGPTTGDALVENTANTSHYVQQSTTVPSAVNDIAYCVAIRAFGRSFAWLEMQETTGGTSAVQYFSLAAGGAVGAVGATGANWGDRRAFTVNLGNNWVLCCMVAYKTNAASTVLFRVGAATADGTGTYLGDGTGAIVMWRATAKISGVPMQPVQSTSGAVNSEPQTGSALYLKGLPASTNGLLLPLDEVEIITSYGSELKIVTASLNSDAAGLGYLQFEPPLRGTPADNAAVIIHQPMGRFLFSGDMLGWDHEPGVFTRASAEFEEA